MSLQIIAQNLKLDDGKNYEKLLIHYKRYILVS